MRSLLTTTALLPLALAQSLCGQYDYHSSGGYYLNNNEWGAGSGSGEQCTYVDKYLDPGVQWHTEWSWPGGDNNVKSYPYAGISLPSKKLVQNIGSLPSKAEWRYTGNNVRANVAYDLFTSTNPNHDTSSGDFELMIWLARKGNVYPIGSSRGNVNIGGQNWELFFGYNGAMKVFSFVAPSELGVWEGNVKNFFDHMNGKEGFSSAQQYLITFQFGTEPFTGSSARFDCWYWYAQQN